MRSSRSSVKLVSCCLTAFRFYHWHCWAPFLWHGQNSSCLPFAHHYFFFPPPPPPQDRLSGFMRFPFSSITGFALAFSFEVLAFLSLAAIEVASFSNSIGRFRGESFQFLFLPCSLHRHVLFSILRHSSGICTHQLDLPSNAPMTSLTQHL